MKPPKFEMIQLEAISVEKNIPQFLTVKLST